MTKEILLYMWIVALVLFWPCFAMVIIEIRRKTFRTGWYYAMNFLGVAVVSLGLVYSIL